MATVTIDEVQQNLLHYLRRAEIGETLIILRADKPIAELKPVRKLRPFGLCGGEFTVPDDFDAPLPDAVIQEFYGA